VSTGATLSADQKRAFQRRLPNAVIIDMIGASEGGPYAMSMTMPGAEPPETAVFTAPPTFVVRHGANELGHLDPSSLLTNDRSYATVLLAGRSWRITSIDWDRRFAWVEPAERQGRSKWFGSGRALGAELCSAMRDVATGTDPAGVTLTRRAEAALADLRSEFSFARPGTTSVVIEPTRARWWTWAGQLANASLSDSLGELAASRGDDQSIGLDPQRASTAEVRRRLRDLHPDTLPTPGIAADFAENMKFSDCLPPALAMEVARQRLVDPPGVRRVLEELGPAESPG
jgi:ATP-dependent Lhr-like helicase